MKWNASFKPVIAFIALMFICHELHELIHTSIAYWQCGCWGERDFNVWTVCKACPSTVNTVWATLAGPLLTYSLIWSGWWLMSPHHSIARRSVGFALVWANVPFARLITVLMKGGDEGVIARAIVGQPKLSSLAWSVELIVILMLILPAFIRSWKLLLPNRRLYVFISFLIIPMLLEYTLMHKLGGSLLKQSVLDQQVILGSPLLVLVWNIVWLSIILLTASSLTLMLKEEKMVQRPVKPLPVKI